MPYRLGALIALVLLLARPGPTLAQTAITIGELETTLEFPEQITFRARIDSGTPIQSIVLEYGVDKQTCGTVIAKAFPDVPESLPADIEWTWQMLQSGSEPAGATIWYRWRVTDTAGNEQVSPTERVTWLDDEHSWKTVSGGNIRLHWYAARIAMYQRAEQMIVDAAPAIFISHGIGFWLTKPYVKAEDSNGVWRGDIRHMKLER